MTEHKTAEPPAAPPKLVAPKPPKLVYDKVTYHCGCVAIGLTGAVPHYCIGHSLPGSDTREKTEQVEAEQATALYTGFAPQTPQPAEPTPTEKLASSDEPGTTAEPHHHQQAKDAARK